MARSTITGIDIGTHQIKVVIGSAEEKNEKGLPKVLGTGMAESRGLRHGYITNPQEVSRSIQEALSEAEKKAGVRVKKAFVAIGGVGLGSVTSTSSIVISRADSEITELDIKKVHDQCEKDLAPALTLNKKIINSIPIQYKLDGKVSIGRPEGLKASKFEVKMLYITCLEQHLDEIIDAVEGAGISVQDVMAGPIAASFVMLSKSQKMAGCVLANIGAETASVAVFENNTPVSLETFAIGSKDITNDIALGLRITLEEAEQIKIGAITGSSYPRKKLEEIIAARLSDIFDLVESHLKKIGRNGLLPAGIVITGGGAGLSGIEELAKNALRLPARIGSMQFGPQEKQSLKDSVWSVAYGLCVLGAHTEEEVPIDTSAQFFIKMWRGAVNWLKQFLP